MSAKLFLGLDINEQHIQACHKDICPNKNCWNPEHLYLGSNQQNQIQAAVIQSERSFNGAKGICLKGHSFNDENTIIRKNGSRACRICANLRNRQYLHRKKGQIIPTI